MRKVFAALLLVATCGALYAADDVRSAVEVPNLAAVSQAAYGAIIHVQGAVLPGDGGGAYYLRFTQTCTPDGAAILKDKSGFCFYRIGTDFTNVLKSYGAYIDAATSASCSITQSTASLSCSGITFSMADAGKTVVCQFAGATRKGARNDPLIASIIAGSGVATLSLNASNTISAGGPCAWGHDDAAAILAAEGATSPTTALFFSGSMLTTQPLQVGNQSPAWAHIFVGLGQAQIYFGLPDHTTVGPGTGNNCLNVRPYNGGGTVGYTPAAISNITLNCMNSGGSGISIYGGQPIKFDHVFVNDAWKNCEESYGDANAFVQQVYFSNSRYLRCGLHNIYLRANDNSANGNGFLDEFTRIDTFVGGRSDNGMAIVGQNITAAAKCSVGNDVCIVVADTSRYTSGQNITVVGVGGTTEANGVHAATIINATTFDITAVTFVNAYTSGGMAAPSMQLGCSVYAISTGTGNDNLIVRHHYIGAVEMDDARSVAQSYGSDINPDKICIGNGRNPHVLEAAAVPTASLSAVQSWNFTSPTMEDSTGQHAPGYTFNAETGAGGSAQLIPLAIRVKSAQNNGTNDSGYWNNATINTGSNCSVAGGCGNEFDLINDGGNIPVDHHGGDIVLGGTFVALQALADQSTGTIQTPLTGTSVTFSCTQGTMLIKPAGTLATLTVNLPNASCPAGYFLRDKQVARFSFTQAITALTVQGPGSGISTPPTAAAAGQGFSFIYNAGDFTWYRLQ